MNKKSLCNAIILALILFSACSPQKAERENDPILISGKITSPIDTKVMIRAGNESYSIELNEDGSFADTLKIPEGYYLLVHKNESTNTYMIPGTDLNIELDTREFDESLTYIGSGATVNNYLAKKTLRNEQERKTFDVAAFYSAEEGDYTRSMNERFDSDVAFLNSYNDLPETFIEWEKKDIEYGKMLSIVSYKSGHEYFTKKTDFQPSEGFLKPLSDLDKDNDDHFKNLENYRSVIINHYSLISRDPEKFDEVSAIVSGLKSPLIKQALINDLFYQVSPSNENLSELVALINANSDDQDLLEKVNSKYETVKDLAKGMPSPSFTYEDINGKLVSLKELKGKLVYIDVWATWCGPCKREIPYLKEVEEKFHNKNIEFVSVSVDKQRDKEKWRSMVSDKELGGIQVIADQDWSSPFVKDYGITGIPRFLLIDENGNIINADAPRPSDPRLEELFAEYLQS